MYFKIEDPLGREIVLPSGSWNHIQERHPEIQTPNCVEITVATPNIIVPSARKTDRDIYYKIGAHNSYPPLYVAVVVGFRGDEGTIITAHLSGPVSVGAGGYKYVSKK